jgi:hypothetical protein
MIVSTFVTIYFWLFLVAFGGWVVFWAIHTLVTSNDEDRWFTNLRGWLSALLYRGYHDSYISFTDRHKGQTVRFQKYIRGKGKYGLEYRVAGSDWVKGQWQRYQAIATSHDVDWRVEPSPDESGNSETLVFDFGKDVRAAYDFAVTVWIKIFGLTTATPHNIDRDEWATLGEHVDSPDHAAPLSGYPEEIRGTEQMARYKKAKLPGCSAILGLILLFAVEIASGIGFPICMLRTRGATPEWVINLGSVTLGGSFVSVVLFLAFLITHWLTESSVSRLQSYPRLKENWEYIYLNILRALVFALPVAALLTWAGF